MSAPTPLTYNAFVTQLGLLAVEDVQTVGSIVQGVSASFTSLIPTALNYAELRIQRDLDLSQLQTSSAYTFTSGNNVLQIPVADFVTVDTLSVSGVPLLPVSKAWLQNVYGTNANSGPPAYFAPYGGDLATAGNAYTNILVGPYPDSAYAVTVTGTIRAPSLNANATAPLAGTATTFISAWLPDLLLQAAMIVVSEFQRNFSGVSANDPQMPMSYETVYENLLNGAVVEEARRRFAASGWTSLSPPLVATPGR